ncbi:hypothetical protein A3732_08340 [Oleiphilus sp. HI0050]|nr:hypothetical protein A3732_08340 [Oleiphilus sp. HI0050]
MFVIKRSLGTLLVAPYVLMLLAVSFLADNVVISVVCIVAFYLYILTNANDGTLSDPRSLFLGFFVLYSVVYPLRVEFTGLSLLPIERSLLVDTLNYHFIAMIMIFTVISIFRINQEDSRASFFSGNWGGRNSTLTSELVLWVPLLSIVFFGILTFITSGASSKRELVDGGGGIHAITEFSVLFAVLIFSFRAVRLVRVGKPLLRDIPILFFCCVMLLNMLASGERDILFRSLLMLFIIILDASRKATGKVVFSLIFGAFLLVPVSQAFKSVLLTGSINFNAAGLELLLSNEFMVAARNFYSLLYFDVEHSAFHLVTDLIRAIFPSFLLGEDITSTVVWFHNVFRVENGFPGSSGWGFGIIAQGYLVGGVGGVVFIGALLGGVLVLSYNRRFNSIYCYVFHVVVVMTSIYVMRADLTNLISQLVKVNGLFLALLYLFHKLFKVRQVK